MNSLIFLLISAFSFGEAIRCYSCSHCGESEGVDMNCPAFGSRSCYLVKVISTGQISKICGVESMGFFGESEGCYIQGDSILCRCATNLCNTNSFLSSTIVLPRITTTMKTTIADDVTTNTTTTTTTATTSSRIGTQSVTSPQTTLPPDGDSWFCYYCYDCRDTAGFRYDCAQLENSTRSCYSSRGEDGKVSKSCGIKALDAYGLAEGCTHGATVTICKCTSSGCNANPMFDEEESSVGSLTCHYCDNCEDSIGDEVDCVGFEKTASCHLIVYNNTGRVKRSCGNPSSAVALQDGCQVAEDRNTVCICKQANCNAYPNIRGRATATPTLAAGAVSSPVTNQWRCYICENCRSRVGVLEVCPERLESRSCLLIRQQGKVRRTCGSKYVDKEVAPEAGCLTRQQTTICKCVEDSCNAYPGFLDTTTTTITTTTVKPRRTSTQQTQNPFYCYDCVDCKDEFDRWAWVDCSHVRACALMIENGEATRSCSSPTVNILLSKEEGCEMAGDIFVCKCTTQQCNYYSEHIGKESSFKEASTAASVCCEANRHAWSLVLMFLSVLIVKWVP